jgi:uncharacterized secreted repeat protein (TIGR03808 family)
MELNRRRLIAVSALSSGIPVATLATPVMAAPLATLGVDATTLGVRAGGGAEQTNMLQSAIDQTAAARVPLVIGPGEYRVGTLKLPVGAQIVGVRGATRLIFAGGASMIAARGADHITLYGLTLDGAGKAMPEGGALVHVAQARNFRMTDCEIRRSSRNGIVLETVEGAVSGNTVASVADAAIFSRDAQGLTIERNTVRDAGNNGILVWRSTKGDDGTIVADNRIEDIAARRGGSGQYGNAINVFRADNVIVRGNRIVRVAFTGVRGNAASNLQVAGNSIADAGEVAIYAEFGFEGVVIANNTIDGAALGISVTNFNEGGRLAVVQGNLIRNLKNKRPPGTDPNDAAGVGIAVEADASVSGNVIEGAPTAGINLGWGKYLRDVSAVGNVVRSAGIGITVSVADGAGTAVISGNLIASVSRGAIVGMDHAKAVTGDLAKEPSTRFAQLQISGNRVR